MMVVKRVLARARDDCSSIAWERERAEKGGKERYIYPGCRDIRLRTSRTPRTPLSTWHPVAPPTLTIQPSTPRIYIPEREVTISCITYHYIFLIKPFPFSFHFLSFCCNSSTIFRIF